MYKLCWKEDEKVEKKKYRSIEEITGVMSNCIWSGEWVETSDGKRIEMDWATICLNNLNIFELTG